MIYIIVITFSIAFYNMLEYTQLENKKEKSKELKIKIIEKKELLQIYSLISILLLRFI